MNPLRAVTSRRVSTIVIVRNQLSSVRSRNRERASSELILNAADRSGDLGKDPPFLPFDSSYGTASDDGGEGLERILSRVIPLLQESHEWR